MRLLGAVLAGGRATRFGSDKALALYAGRSLIDHAITALVPISAEIVIVGRSHDGLRSLDDLPGPGLGPLAGLNAALAAATEGQWDGVVSVPCDAPQLTASAIALLIKQSGRAAAFAHLPVCGFWPISLASVLAAHLDSAADRSFQTWLTRCDARIVPGPGVWNINTREDLLALQTS